MKSKKLFVLLHLLMLCIISCKTYTVAPESFKKQVIESNDNTSSSFKNSIFDAYYLEFLSVNDKEGNPFEMKNTPAVEMRVTLKNKKRKIMYLNTVRLENDSLKGHISMLLGLKTKVAFSDITKIEIQDGGKNFQPLEPTKDELITENAIKLLDNRGELLERLSFDIDTIHFEAGKFNSLFYVKGVIKDNPNQLFFIYYLNNSALELINIKEEILNIEQSYWTTDLFVENNKVFLEQTFYFTTKNGELVKQKNSKKNKYFKTPFLEKLAFEIYREIENR